MAACVFVVLDKSIFKGNCRTVNVCVVKNDEEKGHSNLLDRTRVCLTGFLPLSNFWALTTTGPTVEFVQPKLLLAKDGALAPPSDRQVSSSIRLTVHELGKTALFHFSLSTTRC